MKTLNVKLLHNYLLLKEVEKEENKSASGLIISNNDRIAYGEVVSIGRGRLLDNGDMSPIDELKVGDKVMYKKGGDDLVTIENESYILVSDVAVVMIFNQ